MFSTNNGGRDNAMKVLLIIVDDKFDTTGLSEELEKLQALNIKPIVLKRNYSFINQLNE